MDEKNYRRWLALVRDIDLGQLEMSVALERALARGLADRMECPAVPETTTTPLGSIVEPPGGWSAFKPKPENE